MFSENQWKVILLVFATASADRPSRALSTYSSRYNVPMFIPRNYKKSRKSRVLFLDEEENRQPFGRGEIDLTQTYDGKIKFDDAADYDFTSPDDTTELAKSPTGDKDIPSGNERFYEPLARVRQPFNQFTPNYYQGRFSRPYAPNFGFDPHYSPYTPVLRNSFYNVNQNGWKARSPRVVFPYQDTGVNSVGPVNPVVTNSHGGPGGPGGPILGGAGFGDNVVFREQNFGLNDVGSEDLSLQDIGTGSADAFAERDANVPHRARNGKTKRMDLKNYQIESTKYIPLKKPFEKPMFIQTDSAKILPPIRKYEYRNISKDIGGLRAVLPKFKPISDEQIIKISEIINQLPIKSTNNHSPFRSTKHKGRRGKILNDNSVEASKVVTAPEIIKADRQDENKCPQGGTCENFIYCWMVGGLLEGTCGGLLKGCCHRVAKAGILGVQDSNAIDFQSSNEMNFGPVINDLSKSIQIRSDVVVVQDIG